MDNFIDKIDQQILRKHLLEHPFYQAWSQGELSLSCLQEYAKEYYQHVKAFPTYLSALHSRTESASTRRMLLQNLYEEEGGSPNHPELWRNFALALGVKEEELDQYRASKEMQVMIATFRSFCEQGSTAEGIGALYSYESQIPSICHSKITGLREYYGMREAKDWEYFSVHIDADKEHAAQERSLLMNYVTKENFEQVYAAVDKTLDVLGNFLTGMCHKYRISCS